MSEKHYPYIGGSFDRIVFDGDGSVWVPESENASLRERITTQKQTIQAYRDESREWREVAEHAQAENAKLRELVRDMWFWHYCGHIDSEPQEKQMKHIDGVLDRMRELEVDG